MKKEPLSSLCDVKNGYAFKSNDYVSSGYRVIRITNVQKGFVVDDDPKFIPNAIANKTSNFKLKLGDMLISLTGNVGRIGRIQASHLPAVLNQRVGLIRPTSEDINDKFLFQYLNSDYFEGEAIKNSNGVAQLNLSSKWIENHLIPLPPLDDQIRIAHLLGKVEGLIAQRKQHLQQLDELLKSVFLEMFGDPVRNEKGWEKKPLGELLSRIDSGWSPKCEAEPANADEWGVLKLSAVTLGEFRPVENKAMLPNVEPKTQHEVKPGDLLFTRKNTYELVAATAYVYKTRPRLLMPDLIFRLVIKNQDELDPIYLWKLLSYPSQRKKIQSFAAGAAGSMPNISKANLKMVGAPVPDIDIQRKFTNVVHKVETVKRTYQKSLVNLESLYGALSQKAFKGELDLSHVPLLSVKVEEEIAVVTEPWQVRAEESLTIHLPDTDNLLESLENVKAREALITQWLEAYRGQLGAAPFSVLRFMAAAQTRLVELHPEESFELGPDDYEHIKTWAFEALASGTLMQAYDDTGNRIQLKVGQA
ncbi:MAG: restriction endonuclease subunit S [Gammaproteobacteria bacterium]|jgi:type I restriction enzyme S subunit|nr:restriction endonuclease subunit S [Gammaproteobacteria bacterium]MBQ0774638.1 restriction endonuclease subunit S [Gammaproteobacteria bacterium]